MSIIVGIDASRYPAVQRTGTETYSHELLNAMAENTPSEWDVRAYTNRASVADRANLAKLGQVRSIPFPRLWTHARLSAEMIRHRPDLLFVPSHVIPLVHPRSVVTIHDLGYLHEPESHPPRQVRMLDATTRWNARTADMIIAISETTRIDLIERYKVSADKIRVVHHGVSKQFRPVTASEHDRIRRAYGLPARFVLAVGTIQPRKNLVILAAAISRLRVEMPDLGLVLAGRAGWMADEVMAEIRARLPGPELHVLNYVPGSDLPALYGAASVMAMVSRYEGFGLPVLEAMACGNSVVISDTPALVEVAGGAASIASTTDVDSIADAIQAILDGRVDRRDVGLIRASEFTWERCASETIRVLADAL